MPAELEELRTLTIKELAEATGIQAWRLRELINANHGPPHFRVGRVIRFRVTDVRSWMEGQTNRREA